MIWGRPLYVLLRQAGRPAEALADADLLIRISLRPSILTSSSRLYGSILYRYKYVCSISWKAMFACCPSFAAGDIRRLLEIAGRKKAGSISSQPSTCTPLVAHREYRQAASHPVRMDTPAIMPALPANLFKTLDCVAPRRSKPAPRASPVTCSTAVAATNPAA